MPLIQVTDLVTSFQTDEGYLRAVDGVSFEIELGKTLGIVGESGCGKSVTALSIMGLVPSPPGRVEEGQIVFEDTDLLKVDEKKMRSLRGNDIAMIFQEPMTSLNPVYRVGVQISEAVRLHQKVSKKEARDRAIELLGLVGIPAPEKRVDAYPHTLSGGMRQRAMIAMALACQPKLLIADEPTTALDVTIQAQILDLLKELQAKFQMSILLITHDLGVVAEFADDIAVMYAGKIVEYADTRDLFNQPRHPYTRGLLNSLPSMRGKTEGHRLATIAGIVPDLRDLPTGCRFQDRCDLVEERCHKSEPELEQGRAHRVACHVAGEVAS